MAKMIADSTVMAVLQDYRDNNDKVEVIAKRHGVTYQNIISWAKKAGLDVRPRYRNWGAIKNFLDRTKRA